MCRQFSSELYGLATDALTGMFFFWQYSIIAVRPGKVWRNRSIRHGAMIFTFGSRASAANWNRHWSLPLPVAP